MASPVRVRVRVRPGARRTLVGGQWDPPDGDRAGRDPVDGGGVLVVVVTAPAADGRANAAVCAAVARALGVRGRDVRIVTGDRSRDKVLEVVGDAVDLAARLEVLRRS